MNYSIKIKCYLLALLAFSPTVVFSVEHCLAIERDVLKNKGTCTFTGKTSDPYSSTVITPHRKFKKSEALDALFMTATLFEIGKIKTGSILVLLDNAANESLLAEGSALRIPDTSKPKADFQKNVQFCKIINWESRCTPYR